MRRAPKPAPAHLKRLVPKSEGFETLEDWLRATCEATEGSVVDLASWCGMHYSMLYRWLKDPGIALSRKGQVRLHDALGVSVDELERLRPSAGKRSQYAIERTQRDLAIHGADHYSRMGQKSAEKTRGVPLAPERAKKNAYARWSRAGSQKREDAKEVHAAKQKGQKREPGAGATWVKNRDLATWDAKNKIAAYKRRKHLTEEQRRRVKEMRLRGSKLTTIQRELGVSRNLLRREMGDMGLIAPSKQTTSPEELAAARKLLETEAQAAARQEGRKTQRTEAFTKIRAAHAELEAEGKAPTGTALRKRSGCRLSAVKAYMDKHMATDGGRYAVKNEFANADL